jgi:hypothetical protein
MKMDSQSQSISQSNYLKRCARALKELSLQLFSLCLPEDSRAGFLQTLSLMRLPAFLGWIAGNVKVAWNEVTTNDRIFVGFVLMGVGGLFYQAHLLFIHPEIPSAIAFINDPAVPIEVWYYKRWFYWFFTQREEFFFGSCSVGLFLMWPQKSAYRYAFVPLLVACVAEIFYQSFFISDWTHFYRGFFTLERGWEGIAILVALVFAIKRIIDYQVHRKYHTKDGNTCRMVGLIEMNIPWADKEATLKNLAKEYRDYNSRV